MGEYADNIYVYEEVQGYLENPPKRKMKKYEYMKKLEGMERDEVNELIEKRLKYIMKEIKVLDTHFVAGVSKASERTQATPRADEFNVVAVDIVLRYPEHRFLFANPKVFERSGSDSNHLQQNYVIGFVFRGENREDVLHTTEDWYDDLQDVHETLNPKDCVLESDMQVDIRKMITDGDVDMGEEV